MGQYYKPVLIAPDGRILSINPHENQPEMPLRGRTVYHPSINAA